MNDRNAGGQDLLIIRRNGSAELDHPKGGVWKIAYADFMTAMMAFFLVMWLINATSESTRTGIANYFNPIRLSDGMQLPRKGLRDPDLVEPGAPDPAGHGTPDPDADAEDRQHAQGDTKTGPSRGKVARYSEEALFRDPYAVLAAIAAEAEAEAEARFGLDSGGSGRDPGAAGELDRIGSQPYRDPFDPPARTPVAPRFVPQASTPSGDEADMAAGQTLALRAAEAGQRQGARIADELAARDELAAMEPVKMADGANSGAGNAASAGDADVAGDRSVSPRLEEWLLESLAEDASTHPMPNVTVKHGDDGVLISLSDQIDFGMFAIGSAEPLPETIAVMEKIAEVLKKMPGNVIIRGHTDGRPFRSASYDNWRLSAARAHMAYYMLVRGGLDEARVSRIEGHADRDLKLPRDPEAAENRRIEILVQEVPS